MRRALFPSLAAALAAAAISVAFWASAADAPAPVSPQQIADGKYLAAAGDCVACHTAPGGTPFAGGTVIETPFGKLLGPNLTPDKDTGIGGWSDDEFVRALKYGRGHNGIRLYPGMPYIYFNTMPRSDIVKIHDYLDSLAPVHHQVVANQLPFPFNIRLVMFGWNILFFPNRGDFQPDASQDAEWNRGAYLAEGPGHCAACHTPKNILGGDKTAHAFEGAALGDAFAPALVNTSPNGLGVWTADDVAAYLKTGHNAYADANGPMEDVVVHSTSQLTLADDRAIGIYLKSLSPSGGTPAAALAATDPAMQVGARIYGDECSSCHTTGGTGQADLIPGLKASPVVNAADPVSLVQIVLHGGQSVSTEARTGAGMPAFGYLLNDQEAADVLTYIRNSWGNAAPAVTPDKVKSARSGGAG